MEKLNCSKISVCMATYNGAAYVLTQLQSILAQLSPNDEIIVADDGSTDGTIEKIRTLNDSRIVILPPSQVSCMISGAAPLGPIYNVERALSCATGDVVFLADQDDVWLEGKVQKMVAAFSQASRVALSKPVHLAIHDAFFLQQDSNGDFKRGSLLSSVRPFKKGVLANWFKNRYTGCCMAFTREVLLKALPFPKALPMHDQWLGLVAEKFFDVAYVKEPLIEYRQHKNNATHIAGGKASLKQRIRWRLDLLSALKSLNH